jgi:diphosphomevalonate decarboxylase
VFRAEASPNIALIKYMGKTQTDGNKPANSSLSFTLEGLRTVVELRVASGTDRWVPLSEAALRPLALSPAGQDRFLSFLSTLKTALNLNHLSFEVASANSFPADAGVASSASSFAALTRAAGAAARSLLGVVHDDATLSALSQRGSGSSCRSFFSPWSIWDANGARPCPELTLRLRPLLVVVADHAKDVSSSRAHERVLTSELFAGRPERAERRLLQLVSTLSGKIDWREAFEITWAEFWDMHSLFETSRPAFGYMTPGSLEVLRLARDQWVRHGDGPLVTMDAGPNVHLLFRTDQERLKSELRSLLSRSFLVMEA